MNMQPRKERIEAPSHAYFVRPDSVHAQRPKISIADSVLEVHEWIRWEKFLHEETKIRLDVFNTFFATNYHLIDSYAMVKGEKVPFYAEEINTLYGLSNNLNEYHALRGWMKHYKDVLPFPSTVEKLCLKYLPTLAKYPQIKMSGRVNLAGLSRISSLHQNKEEERCQKTQKQRRPESESDKVEKSPPHQSTSRIEVDATKEIRYDPSPLKRKRIKLKNKRLVEENSPVQSNLQQELPPPVPLHDEPATTSKKSKTPPPPTKFSSSTKLPPPKIQTPHSFPLQQKTVLLGHAPSNPSIINLDSKYPDLNVSIVNLLEGDGDVENAAHNASSLNTAANDETP
ncbi:hypothetical protein E5676_scaffold2750G00200 [Cucumis melo var. makuwa]|uniref:Uncharacterized protein n=1 Tax=Cucumis melo var. makuwa TaxID=1194695 RepID=A0A5A7ULS0_CUCMM|nr:hypothetical protein E6C27_scaffold24G001450 [Cucumis melo var. makuwa]TYJ96826.1 hypothetical protein E5676_scaffold2750G00200 [Cucumis melo var. makuwa]